MKQKIDITEIIENRDDITLRFSDGKAINIPYRYKTIKDVDEYGIENHIAYLSDNFIANFVYTIIMIGMSILGYFLFGKFGTIIGLITSLIPGYYYSKYDKANKREELLNLGMYQKDKRVIDNVATQKEIYLILEDINK